MDNSHIDLLGQLISFRTVTPATVASMAFCQELLEQWGFNVRIHQSGSVPNLVAYLHRGNRTLCIAGHLDVVEPGNNWDYNPFELTEHNSKLYGRGTNDMKGPLAAALVAIRDFIKQPSNLSIMVLLTGDEEVMTDDGMKSLMSYVYQHHKSFYLGIIPESCSPGAAGEYIKIGCRGSMNIDMTSTYPQGHVANTSFNHLHQFIKIIDRLIKLPIDTKSAKKQPSTMQLTSIDVGNNIRNMVPNNISAQLNIRFNGSKSSTELISMINDTVKGSNSIKTSITVLSTPFIGCSRNWVMKLKTIMEYFFLNYLTPNIDTQTSNSNLKSVVPTVTFGVFGGNSDAKTLHEYMNVVEIGTPLAQAHISNEFITTYDINKLRCLYYELLVRISAQTD